MSDNQEIPKEPYEMFGINKNISMKVFGHHLPPDHVRIDNLENQVEALVKICKELNKDIKKLHMESDRLTGKF